MAEPGAADRPAITEDLMFGGRLRLRQPAKGHRAGTDAVLLAAVVASRDGPIVDVGAGVGTAGLAVALRAPAAELVLIEIDPLTAELARENIALNGMAARSRVVETDVTDAKARRAAGLADGKARLVLTNPPYFDEERFRTSPDARRRRAHVLVGSGDTPEESLRAWLRAALALLAPGGTFAAIHRPESIGDFLAVADGRLGDLRILPIHPRADVAAVRIVVAGTKASRAPMQLLPGLILHSANGDFTPQAEAIHRGERLLPI